MANLQPAAEAAAEKSRNRQGEEGWALGYRRAQALRDVLDLDETQRFPTYDKLAVALGASTHYALAPAVDGIRLLRSHRQGIAKASPRHRQGIATIHMRTHGKSAGGRASHLFTFARGVADVVCFPGPQKAPVNDLRSAYRQSAGRAFAAEFLAPVNEVLSMQNDGRDTVSIAEEFAVSTAVIEHQIENASRIRATTLR